MIKNLIVSSFIVWFIVMLASSTYDESDNWQYACHEINKELNINCDGMAEPTVVVSSIVASLGDGVKGVYLNGEDSIFILSHLPTIYEIQVIRHEMIHYIIYKAGLRWKLGRCEGERLARLIAGGEWGEKEQKYYDCLK